MSEIKRFDIPRDGNEFMHEDPDGEYVQYDDHRAEVERLQNSANLWQHDAQQLTLTVDGLKRELHEIRPEAHLLRAEVKGLIRERNEVRNAAQIEATQLRAEVERLTKESEQRRVANHRIMVERNEAREQVYRLQQACGDKGANGQGMLDTSRPSDETIWWKAFNSFLRDDSLTIEEVADQAQAALTIYRARWPR